MRIKMKRFLGILLSLALVLGLMPGMSLTAYAAPEETLLTTITPTNQTTYSETTSGVVTVSHNNDDYYGQYGWLWSSDGTLTVSGCEGYTITKVIFKQYPDRTVTDSSAPFELHFVQQGEIGMGMATSQEYYEMYHDIMDGVSSIEVYGYANKAAQTITASDVTATYGDTDKSVNASVTTPATGGGAISYAVKDGSGDYIDVASDGKLTIKKVPASGRAYVIVKAAETDDYAETPKEVTVTISKANAVAATVTANNRTYDGTEKPLVTVTGEPTGSTMQYALGNATEATQSYTTSIPTATNAGTYYVWYKVAGDENHSDATPACVIAKIDKGNPSANIPEKETIKYSGEPQELVTPGTVENGTMMYALGSDDKTAPVKEEFSTSIPTGTSVGTYYVWYYAKGDAGYEDTTPVCVIVTIYELRADAEIDKSKLPDGKNTSVAGDIPIPEGLLSEAQKANNGNEKVELKLVVAPKGEEKAAESEALQKDAQMSNSVKSQYKDETAVSVEVLEIDIEKYINDVKADNVIETSKVLEIAIPYNFDGKYDPSVVRRHGDGAHVFTALTERPTGEPKDGTFFADRDNHILYIYANLFSTYVVAYSTVEGNARVVSAGSSSSQVDYPKTIPVYRLYNKYKGAHLLTTNNEERDILLGEKATEGWIDEGIAFNVAVNSSAPVYRVFDLKNGIHFYTTDAATRDTYVANGCRDEGIAWYAALKPGRTVYKVSNPSNGRILYTISKSEADALTNSGYTCQEAEFVVY